MTGMTIEMDNSKGNSNRLSLANTEWDAMPGSNVVSQSARKHDRYLAS